MTVKKSVATAVTILRDLFFFTASSSHCHPMLQNSESGTEKARIDQEVFYLFKRFTHIHTISLFRSIQQLLHLLPSEAIQNCCNVAMFGSTVFHQHKASPQAMLPSDASCWQGWFKNKCEPSELSSASTSFKGLQWSGQQYIACANTHYLDLKLKTCLFLLRINST